MRRREFIAVAGAAAAAWPLLARAQQASMPVVGYLNPVSPDAWAGYVAAFRHGLEESGYVEGSNVAIEYRWARGDYERLPTLAAELARIPVTVIASTGESAAVAAKGATQTIPIVFTTARDPVTAGLVTSLNRPSGNLTGVSFIFGELVAKRLQLLTELLPAAKSIAMLVNPSDSTLSESNVRATEEAARVLGLRVYILKARREAEFDEAFAALIRQGAAALLVDANAFFNSERERIVALASRYRVPAIYQGREFTDAGGLLSYGPRLVEGFRQVGLYVGKILSGAKPADLPVIQLNKVELVVNLKTAKSLGLAIPQSILARADEVIE